MSIEIEDGATDEEDTGQGWELGVCHEQEDGKLNVAMWTMEPAVLPGLANFAISSN